MDVADTLVIAARVVPGNLTWLHKLVLLFGQGLAVGLLFEVVVAVADDDSALVLHLCY